MKVKGWEVSKKKVELDISPQLNQAMVRLDRFSYMISGFGITITCGSEETATHTAKNTKHHAKNNASGLGEAVDIRTHHYTQSQRIRIEKAFYEIKNFKHQFDLIWEHKENAKGIRTSEHWHLEYDPKN